MALEKLDHDVTVVRKPRMRPAICGLNSRRPRERHRGKRMNDMFNTHPPLSERINLLRKWRGYLYLSSQESGRD